MAAPKNTLYAFSSALLTYFGDIMRLSRGYQWKLELSDNELKVILKTLNDAELTEEDTGLAEHLFDTISENRDRKLNHRQPQGVAVSEEDSEVE